MTYYEVWGWDTFAGEAYSCGRYATLAQAQHVLKKQEESVLSQDEDLRDTFSIQKVTDEDIRNREKREEHICNTREREQSYNLAHLRSCTGELLLKFREVLLETSFEQWQELSRNHRFRTVSVLWNDAEDCFTEVFFEILLMADGRRLSVCTGVNAKSGEYSSGGRISVTSSFCATPEQLLEATGDEDFLQQCVEKFASHIRMVYEDD